MPSNKDELIQNDASPLGRGGKGKAMTKGETRRGQST